MVALSYRENLLTGSRRPTGWATACTTRTVISTASSAATAMLSGGAVTADHRPAAKARARVSAEGELGWSGAEATPSVRPRATEFKPPEGQPCLRPAGVLTTGRTARRCRAAPGRPARSGR